ncbi:N-formylglutamate amidohydrolase [Roseibium litorale]|uniref:N-formylglutamate amidohydrolase n=1 Tax=Roseibium litorale TaxID=2803841 RepID=A0ABR9CMY6_9HYPH|nr:N-formylglutamate amidohydrolase [Roseibium litorale]MBD8892234.1 N-formylglutamate amidohydrolase [Roseibium litorale]
MTLQASDTAPDVAVPPPVKTLNEAGTGPFVLVCDHASNRVPPGYGTLGLSEADLKAHIAWDPGALGVAQALSRLTNSPLVHSNISRLIIDCNRDTSAPDLIPPVSELTVVPGNQGLDEAERERRIALSHTPFHAAIDALIEKRLADGRQTAIISIHTYTPIYKGIARPWEIGLIYDTDASLAEPALAALKADAGLTVGDNEPYSPADGVYYTLKHHGQDRGLKSLMIEIRNNEVATPEAELEWAERLAPVLMNALEAAGGQDA